MSLLPDLDRPPDVEMDLREFYGPNAGYVAELYERSRQAPEAVDAGAHGLFAGRGAPAARPAGRPAVALEVSRLDVSTAAEAAALAQAIRLFGHLDARLDPLGSAPPGDLQLEPSTHGVSQEELVRLPASVVGGPAADGAPDAAEAIRRLRALYCGTTGYELAHVADPDERAWLMDAVEARRYAPPADPEAARGLLDRLTEVSAFERFLHRAYPGQTRFSVEGLGMLIPMLDELVDRAAEQGVRSILLGMAHRGRLNVLAHVLGKPYERILGEFEGLHRTGRAAASESTDDGWAGDVKYHAGGQRAEGTLTVSMAPNPSHLEFVNPVVEGMARAAQEQRRSGPGAPQRDEAAALAVLIHGDAAFPGQGVVAETLNLSRLPGYRTGGTLHLIANNQLGFTTEPADARSTLYASDLAKGFEVPVVHVNAQDPAACLAAIRLAVAYRDRFRKDVLIDLIGYRRWGHNEGDEPSFTQPSVYARVAALPTVREQYAAGLVARGVVAAEEPDALLAAGLDEFQRIRESVLARKKGQMDAGNQRGDDGLTRGEVGTGTSPSTNGTAHPSAPASASAPAATAVPPDRLRDLNRALSTLPDGFALNPKLERPLQRRRAAFEQDPAAPIDWGHAESLAFASILQDGTPIRLTGQDVVRGTFSQRHATFFDARTGEPVTPLAALPGVSACFDVRNSPLSETAVLGFEYGYSVQAPETLVVWEAQYGDFINGAQVIVDEFVASGQAKWGLRSGLVLLLPHAWEGQGPDHSGGRLERFLELAAEDNIRVANCTTAAQYFHLLRQQAASLRGEPKPLVVMTPKSLLRHALSASYAADFTRGGFQPLLEDPLARAQPEQVRRVALCSGHVWAELAGSARRADATHVAIVRLEQLYPFPDDGLRAALAGYPRAEEVLWVQEEPANMGAWPTLRPTLEALVGQAAGRVLRYVGRPASASPAEGWADRHAREQRRIMEEALAAPMAGRRAPASNGRKQRSRARKAVTHGR